MNQTPVCGCESSLCDHSGPCPRPVDPTLVMAYVIHTCTTCAENMRNTGGSQYISFVCPAPSRALPADHEGIHQTSALVDR